MDVKEAHGVEGRIKEGQNCMAKKSAAQWVRETVGDIGKSVSLKKMYEAGKNSSRPRGKK